ncbi:MULTISPECIES: bifunctional 4-hydroxy-2-oxoglutarate aldolase/2-dehydro-3-deoxy-phosphogluconate aldolase [Clostridium]|uniref:bifunctional 4-hydroxy-2-oxoglutarate aldolase/2-dehydro-3-deoxy-phosphogluconate aldolase n=1 Tax=Clostridium TaxID=1485 RepID=UPI000825ABC5|nr:MULTISPECIES: bifunctional 4-hydroxy-2-oxoglutarate aldolase/2-dehydro-3-deoxy-phosphogluconate aldolase [Clostridium]PJI07292.1 bifunctional 2-keto-4-hydroxyglutarate aldolase/2-keto-3-deoxy-6-phosphogluconate aldolase [Clostridium sp. CT7]
MTSKFEILKRISDVGVVAVVRANSEDEAVKISKACADGGVNIIELTFTVPGADNVIKTLNNKFKDELLVGAGTVLDSETARVAILAGAKFIVSPCFNLEAAKLCNRYGVPYIGGCMTINEIVTAMEAGQDIIKLFPGSAYGPSIINEIKGPLPQAQIMPTGGVSLDNVKDWIKNGCVAVGVGGKLTGPAKEGNYAKVTENAKEFVSKVKEARAER